MPTSEKIQAVAEFKEKLESCQIAIASQYIGMNVAQATELRKQLREAGVDFKVYKNNLSRLALRELEVEEAADCMEGPTAWAFCEDPVTPAKILKEYGKSVKFVKMMGGVLEGKAVGADQLQQLADLPSREQLLAQVVGTIAAPLRNLVGTLNAVPTKLVRTLDALKTQKEENGEAAA